MNDVVVLVPRRAGDTWRDGLWEHVRASWVDDGFRVVEGHHDDGPFNRSAAINTAAHAAGGWSVAVIADADTIVDKAQVYWAIGLAMTQRRAVLAYDELVSLDKPGTEKALTGAALEDLSDFVRWTNTKAVSSCIVVPRTLWDEAGGFDERFTGWGAEDRAFYLVCHELGGHIARVHGPAWHLWHPRSAEKNPNLPEYQANFELVARYRRASRRGPQAMLDLLAER